MESSLKKIQRILVVMFLLIAGLYFAQDFLIPITIAALLAFLLLPIARRLERAGLSKIFSISICLIFIVVLIFSLIFLFYMQLSSFIGTAHVLKLKANEKFNTLLHFIESKTSISSEQQLLWISEKFKTFKNSSILKIENVFFTTTNLVFSFGLIVIYIFCFLNYREKFRQFFIYLFKPEKKEDAREIIISIQSLSLKYFSGMLLVILILGTMHSIGLLLLGIDHAFFLGYLAGFFIIVPFIGTMIGSIIPIIVALLTKDSLWSPIGVMCVFSFNLFIESQILTPVIIGSHVKINPMAIIIIIVIGGLIWGLPGMVLFIPLLGIFKIICDHFESLHSIADLLSDDKKKIEKISQN